MVTASLCTIVLTMLGVIPGQTEGWGTGEVYFRANVRSSEHQEIYPVCAGLYTVEVVIRDVLDDPQGLLEYVTKLDVCYNSRLNLVSGNTVEVRGIYYDGACPLAFCGRADAISISKVEDWEEPEEPEEPNDIETPWILTSSAEAMETTATLQAVLDSDGGEPCRCRFLYRVTDGPWWPTEWKDGVTSNSSFSQKIAALAPGTRYYYRAEAYNSAGWSGGREGTFTTLVETVPPIPHPAIWVSGPGQIDATSIAMVADIERDVAGPEEYMFDFVASPTGGAGGSDSIWQFSPIYTDVGLNPNHQYGYRVKGRDGHGNETAYSAIRHEFTDIETPEGVSFGPLTTTSIQVKAVGALSGLARGQSGLKLENVTAGQMSAWLQDNAFWTSDGLLPNTRYGFRAQARNGDGDPTPYSQEACTFTLALVPTAALFSNVTVNEIHVYWGSNGNPPGTQYLCENTVRGTNSGWTENTQWIDTTLSPNVQYTYRVKARNGDGVETAFSADVSVYSAIEAPAGIVWGTVTTNSLQAKSLNTPSGLDRGESGLWLVNDTTGQASSWRRNNDFWTSDGLGPNHVYGLRIRARNGDGVLTPYCQTFYAYTLANPPVLGSFTGVTPTSLHVQWEANGNPAGTLYLCENTVRGTNSGWTTSTQWIDTTLSPNVRYTYRVKARNGDGVETAYSAAVSVYSPIETPTGIVWGTTTTNSLQVKSLNTPSGLDQGQSGLCFENDTTGQTSTWRKDNSFWTSDGLLPNRSYGLRVRARNADGVLTPYSQTVYAYTLANPPVAAAFGNVTATSIQVQWGGNGNPSGTLYFCENTTANMNSGWTTGTAWENTGLTPNTSYTYRVKARNANGVETTWTALGTKSTEDYRSLTIDSTPGGQVTAPGQGVLRYEPGQAVSLVASPLAGYHFLRWTGSAVDAGRVTDPNAAQTTVVVDAHYTLTANFLRTAIYVDKRATGTRDGSSWKNAFLSLQDALDVAQVGNEIRVAGGVYKPDAGTKVLPGDRLASFELRNGVALRGGYAGLALSDPNKRDIAVYETVLSGDLKGDDRIVSESYDLYHEITRTDNSFHVAIAVDVGNTTVLEGVTITAGNGVDGAGLSLIRGNLVVSQCIFRANRAGLLSGDGLSGWGWGAGLSCYQSSPILSACLFLNNWAGGQGAGILSIESSPVLKSCTFRDNDAGMQGGGLYGEDSNSILVDCTFHANWGGDGGAVCHTESSDARVTNCRFFGNAARNLGGAIYDAGAGLEVTNGVFSGNLAVADGGAVALEGGLAVLTNCTFNRNLAEGKDAGQALAVRSAVASLTNCILWDNLDASLTQIALTGTAGQTTELIVSYCDILAGEFGVKRNGPVSVTWGKANTDANPQFQSPAGADKIPGTIDDDLRVKPGSVCVDAGDNTAVPTDIDDLNANNNRTERIPLDASGKSRFVDRPDAANTGVSDTAHPGIVDLGAYELPATGS